MKIALTWFTLSALISIALIIAMPGYDSIARKMQNDIKTSAKLQLLDELKVLDTVNKDVIQAKYSEIHSGFKQALINTHIDLLPNFILSILLFSLNLINIIVVIVLLIIKYIKSKNSPITPGI